jgi:uncharacterized protein YkwD
MARGRTRPEAGAVPAPALLGALLAATLAVSLSFAFCPGLAPADAACPHARAKPHQTTLPKLRKAMICLVNHERARRDRRQLARSAKLKLAAQGHNDVMLEKDCFRHDCPGEPGLNRRVRRTGYTKGHEAWRIAEDLGFDNTPRQMLARLLRSRFNRRNLLTRSFRDIGVGVGWGTPKKDLDDSKFATYTLVFAWRRARH